MDSPETSFDRQVAQIASNDFERARRKAFLNELVATFGGKPNWLMAFDEVQRAVPINGQSYRGMQEVPVSHIVGSVDRYHDFDRAFLPTQAKTRPRWESVDRATLTDVVLPPVQLYKIGDVYFVKDGNHRVSVAREKGAQYVDAEVIELVTRVPVRPDTDLQELVMLGEYANFLERTQLDKLRPEAKIEFTELGRYDRLLEHISAHRWYMGIEQDRPIEWEEAVLDWYDNVYMPVANLIEQTDVLRDFPGRKVGDLYLWIMDHRWYLREETGEDIGPATAINRYVEQHGIWTRRVMRYMARLRTMATKPLMLTAQRIARAVKCRMAPEAETHPPPVEQA